MRNLFFFGSLLLVLSSCGNDKEDDVLSSQPFAPLTDSIKKFPSNAGLYYRRGGLLSASGQQAYAEKDLARAWELDPKEEYAVRYASALRKRDSKKAISFLEEALKKLPQSLFIQVMLAQGYRSEGNAGKALAVCNSALQNYPNNIDMLLLKADILRDQGKDAEALSVFETAYQYAPGDVELVHKLGFAYAEASNPKAISLSDSLIAMDTEKSHAEPYYFKGVYYSNTGNSAEAIKQFDQAIRADHNFLDAYINKGIVYYDKKQYDQAMAVFELALNVFPDEADTYYWIAKTQEATGKKADAKLNYERAYNLDKTMTEAKESAERL